MVEGMPTFQVFTNVYSVFTFRGIELWMYPNQPGFRTR